LEESESVGDVHRDGVHGSYLPYAEVWISQGLPWHNLSGS